MLDYKKTEDMERMKAEAVKNTTLSNVTDIYEKGYSYSVLFYFSIKHTL